ncbi:MAG: hypothetical protein EB023_12725 [Flavobacteriia bacterium]|nr:hypothetical protein [Flavobacteriia bacterium]
MSLPAIYCLIFISFTSISYSQGKLVLLPGSEKIYFDKATQTHRLVGTVSFEYQGNTMYCDSAHYKEHKKIVRAYGHVHITKGDISLYCDSLFYSGTNKFARLWGHVDVRDNAYKLTSDSVEYNAKTGRAIYRNKGKIQNSLNKEVITSKVGYFYPSTGSYFFRGKVVYKKDDLLMTTDTLQFNHETQTTYIHGPTLIKNDSIEIHCSNGYYRVDKQEGALFHKVEILQKERTIRCDSVFYKELNQQFTGNGNVRIDDFKANLILLGDRFYSQQPNNETILSGRALAIEYSKTTDSLFIGADTLKMCDDSLNNSIIFGRGNVRSYTKQAQTFSNAAYYSKENGILHLSNRPIVWAKNIELKGDSINLGFKDSLLDKALVKGNATAIMSVDTGAYFNQLSGNKIDASFQQGELKRADVKGQAWTIFYPIEERTTDTMILRERIGLNRLFASELHVYLDSGEVERVTFFDKPDGIFFPINQMDEKEKFIKGFSWNPMLRPKNPYTMQAQRKLK